MTRKKHPAATRRASSPLQDSLERYEKLLSPSDFNLLLEELKKPLKSAIRLNPFKTCEGDLEEWKQRYTWSLKTVPFCSRGYQVEEAGTLPSQTIEHRMGNFYIQDAASMLPAELFDFPASKPPIILDLAASPGGKTTHLVDRILDRGVVIANDSSPDRLTALRIVLQTWSTSSCAVTCFQGERFGGWFPETFDAILLDAPCSMDGLRATEAHPLRPITNKERAGLARRQLALLRSALQAVRVGGEVVYSTCTLAPEEDEGVLDQLLKEYPHAMDIESFQAQLARPAPGLEKDEVTVYNPRVRASARLWPHLFGTAGFFAAKIRKTGSIPSNRSDPPSRPLSRTGFAILKADKSKEICFLMMEDYGFDLQRWLTDQNLELWQHGNQVLALPSLFLQNFPDLPVRYLGLTIGEMTDPGFDPSHDLCTRFGRQFNHGVVMIPEEEIMAWVKGNDLRPVPTNGTKKGKVIVIRDSRGHFLGCGRIQRDRVKNLLPRRAIL